MTNNFDSTPYLSRIQIDRALLFLHSIQYNPITVAKYKPSNPYSYKLFAVCKVPGFKKPQLIYLKYHRKNWYVTNKADKKRNPDFDYAQRIFIPLADRYQTDVLARGRPPVVLPGVLTKPLCIITTLHQ